jgi:enterochelin esterase-like enzyme
MSKPTHIDFSIHFLLICALIFLPGCSLIRLPGAAPTAVTPTLTATLKLETPSPVQTAVSPTPTTTAAATPNRCLEQTGAVNIVSVPGKLQKQSTELRIYTPPCYSAAAHIHYSVLYMLHGQTYTDAQWQQLGLTSSADQLITSGKIPPLIIVMPNESASMSEADTSKFGDALVQEVIPWVDTHYSTCNVRACRAIGGLSRGGNWAVRIGLSHPDLFAVIGAHSAPLFYGDLSRVAAWIKALPAQQSAPMIYIDFGKNDEEKDQMLQFGQELDHLNIVHQLIQFNGFHNADYWSAHVADYLRWYAASLAAPQIWQ